MPHFFAKNVGFFQKKSCRALPSISLDQNGLSVLIHEALVLAPFLHYFEVLLVLELVKKGEEGRFVSHCISVCQFISQVSLDVNLIPSHSCL